MRNCARRCSAGRRLACVFKADPWSNARVRLIADRAVISSVTSEGLEAGREARWQDQGRARGEVPHDRLPNDCRKRSESWLHDGTETEAHTLIGALM